MQPSLERDDPISKPPTRRLAATLFISLDGVVESPDKWSFPYWNDEIAKFKLEEVKATDALLLGRVTSEGFAAAWPGRKDPDGFADRFNSMPKHVASNTLKKLEWNNSHLIKGDLGAAVSRLIYPIALGRGKRLFDEMSQLKLSLAESKVFGTGVV